MNTQIIHTEENETLGPVSILRLFETTKVERSEFVTQLVERLDSGEIDPLKVHLQVKAMEDIIDRLTNTTEGKAKNPEEAKRYRSFLLDSANTHGKKFDLYSGKFEIKEVGTKYDFSQCNDPELVDLEVKAKAAAEALKQRQDFLKTVPEKGMDIITSEGEGVTVYPPSKTSSTSVAVTLK